MPGRSFSSSNGYRYGFNGQEKDDEVKGSGNSLDFGARIYDSRLGRWLASDPKTSRYVGHSPYHFGFNNPIITIDPNGEENLVIVGGVDVSGKQRSKFLNTGLKKLNDYSNAQPNEQTTLVVMTAFMNEKERKTIEKKVHKMQLNGKRVDVTFAENAGELTSYLNFKTTHPPDMEIEKGPAQRTDGNARLSDKITDVTVYGHGYAQNANEPSLGSTFEPGHLGSNIFALPNMTAGQQKEYHDKFTWGIGEASQLNPQAFSNPVWDFQTCNAAYQAPGGVSLVEYVSRKTNGTAEGWDGKCDYAGVNNNTVIPDALKPDIREADNYPKGGYKNDRSAGNVPSERVSYKKGVKQ